MFLKGLQLFKCVQDLSLMQDFIMANTKTEDLKKETVS